MTKRLSAVIGEYTDKTTNQQKAEWASLGIIGVSAKGKEYMLLDPTINLAGVLLKQNILAQNRGEKLSDMVMISIIDEQSQNSQQSPQYQQQAPQQRPQNSGGFQQNEPDYGSSQQQAPHFPQDNEPSF